LVLLGGEVGMRLPRRPSNILGNGALGLLVGGMILHLIILEHGKIAEHWEVVDTGPLVRIAHEPLET
jgi:hypothetical protein